jgi:predicted DNA-binding transcriptional regulator AlpA
MHTDDRPRAEPYPPRRPFLNTPQAAHYLGLSARHLERMRARGTGPRFRRHGRFVFYHLHDLDRWSEATANDHTGPKGSD